MFFNVFYILDSPYTFLKYWILNCDIILNHSYTFMLELEALL